ncbi:MAG TPA: phosphate ABC transporter permease PstA [Gammaproteobacteria bacterium]|nr:phosphate ABC transporter permease PstA [Gammaproteobacteria bacterium]
MRKWIKSGNPWIWLTAGAVSISLLMVVGVLGLLTIKGLVYFWPNDVVEISYQLKDGKQQILVGEIYDEEHVPVQRLRDAGVAINTDDKFVTRYLLKTGNRDISGSDFRWVLAANFIKQKRPEELAVIERREWGNLYGRIHALKQNGKIIAEGDKAWPALQASILRVIKLFSQIHNLEKSEIGEVNYELEQLRLDKRRLELNGETDPQVYTDIEKQKKILKAKYSKLEGRLTVLYKKMGRDSYIIEVMDGKKVEQPVAKVVRAFRPNSMGVMGKLGHYAEKVWEFVSDDPREANTEGGIFPTIFGTILMVLIMSVLVTPIGVIAAIYLREYAKQGPLTRTIRIAVNNLAGVPSIVYGIFGLGFFVYFLGGSIDQIFFPEALPAPTFGTGGILWASLTLALMTLPVVIVSTEEGLSRVPRAIREGSLALGATKAETLWRTVLPMASPAMMTGMILAVARAAGEVAPLMLVGVVKLAPSMPLDWNPPFLHLERKFMHLGFHIYDVGFQSPNVEAARPLVYATALLLVLVIIVLNLASIGIRNHLREKYRSLEQ